MAFDLQQPEPVRRIRDMRPLLFADGRLYCSKYNVIYSTTDWGASFQEECRLALTLKYKSVLRVSRFAQRLARANVYRMRTLANGARIYIFRGGVYCQSPGDQHARQTFAVERGSRPVSLATAKSGLTVFGEYWGNSTREAVRMYGTHDGEDWAEVHRFAAGDIRHVHGVTYDRYEDCFWICTGDREDENQLIRATPDFRQLEIVRQGGQCHRFYMVTAMENHLVIATDSPVERNQIRIYDKRTGRFDDVADIENSSFYNCALGADAYVSTNAEPSPLNDESATYLWTGTPGLANWRRIAGYPVDVWFRLERMMPMVPNGLVQFTRVFFPEGDNPGPYLVCQVIAARGESNSMLVFDPSQWAST